MINSFQATYLRQKRLKEGLNIVFTPNEKELKNNPFGTFNETTLWNEDIAFKKRLRPLPRDTRGKWVKPDTGGCQCLNTTTGIEALWA